MIRRSPVVVVLLTLVTFGIYSIYWEVQTKVEMVNEGAEIPTSWLIIVPIANIYWLWKWSGGVNHVTRGKLSQGVTFILMALLGIIGIAIVQSSLNTAIDEARPNELPQARVV